MATTLTVPDQKNTFSFALDTHTHTHTVSLSLSLSHSLSLIHSPSLQMAAALGDSVKAREAMAALRMGAEPIPSSAYNFFISAIAKAGVSNWEGNRGERRRAEERGGEWRRGGKWEYTCTYVVGIKCTVIFAFPYPNIHTTRPHTLLPTYLYTPHTPTLLPPTLPVSPSLSPPYTPSPPSPTLHPLSPPHLPVSSLLPPTLHPPPSPTPPCLPALLPSQYVNEAKKCYSDLRDSGSHIMAVVFIDLIKAVLKEGDLATAETLRR